MTSLLEEGKKVAEKMSKSAFVRGNAIEDSSVSSSALCQIAIRDRVGAECEPEKENTRTPTQVRVINKRK